MIKIRHAILALGMMLSPAAHSDVSVSIGIGLPHASIGVHIPAYPHLVAIPGYPVYYAPRLQANFFFYDGMYWIFQNDNWYASYWYDGPWSFVSRVSVPVYLLRVPVRYYRHPPPYFHSWHRDAPPRWGDRWGRGWEQQRSGWNRWDRRAVPPPAPLPTYQRRYSGDSYPRQMERQRELHQQQYRYQPREPVVRQHYQRRVEQRAPAQPGRPNVQERRSPQQGPNPREQRELREQRESREQRDPRQQRELREQRDPRQQRELREQREFRGQNEQRDRREQQMQRSQGREDRQQGRNGNDRGRDQERGRGREG